jgi:hypothetical protein
MGLFTILIIIVAIPLYLLYIIITFLFKHFVKQLTLYLERIGVLHYIGDVLYAIGIGVSGNGLYDFITKENFELTAIITGLFAIISGAILRKKDMK